MSPATKQSTQELTPRPMEIWCILCVTKGLQAEANSQDVDEKEDDV
jgi:hypothetical protein